ncbi:HTH-type transcriptional regulator YidZ [Streptomyces hirsutus]
MGDEEEGTTGSGLDRLASVNLNLLVPLLALLEERSVTKAAQRVGLSQPAMSHALTRMRRLLGDDLVVRQGTGMTLTPRALELIPPLRGALQQVAHLVNFPCFDPATDRRVGSLREQTPQQGEGGGRRLPLETHQRRTRGAEGVGGRGQHGRVLTDVDDFRRRDDEGRWVTGERAERQNRGLTRVGHPVEGWSAAQVEGEDGRGQVVHEQTRRGPCLPPPLGTGSVGKTGEGTKPGQDESGERCPLVQGVGAREVPCRERRSRCRR